jgi:predicted acylesterase/phospholipase RssA
MADVLERSADIMSHEMVRYRLLDRPPDLMIEVSIKGVGLFDLDRARVCLAAGEEAARLHEAALVALRERSLPGRWSRWWRSVRRRGEDGG